MGVRARALEKPVLAGESERLVVERLAQQPRVEHLEDVDLRQMPVERRGVGDGVHPVEGVGEVDEATLVPDRGDGVAEGHPARDLLLEEEADDLALILRLDLLAGNHDEVATLCHRDGLERAAEGVVVGDGDAPEPDPLGMVEQVFDLDRAVVRPARVHVQVDGDPVSVGERVVLLPPIAAPSSLRREIGVDLVELGGDDVEALGLRARSSLDREALAQRGVVDEHRDRAWVRDGGSRRGSFEGEALLTSRRRHEDRRLAECQRSLLGSPDGPDVRAVAERARDRRAVRERLRMQEVQLPAGEVVQRADQRPRDRSPGHLELERDHAALPARAEEIDVDADRDEAVVALEPLGGSEHRVLGGREERVDPDAKTIAA